MIEKDIAFLTAVHKAIGHYETKYTKTAKSLIISMLMNDMTIRIHYSDFWIMQKKLVPLIRSL